MESFETSHMRKILEIIFLCKESPAENLNFADEPHRRGEENRRQLSCSSALHFNLDKLIIPPYLFLKQS